MVNKCENCGTDIGNSFWGWCSAECLHQMKGGKVPTLFSPEEILQLKALLKGSHRSFNGTEWEYQQFKDKIA